MTRETRESPIETPGRRRKAHYLLISLAILAFDQWTKWLVEMRLPEHTSVEVIPGLLDLTHVRNTGVAFGFLASHGADGGAWILTGLGLLALGFVGYYFWSVPPEEGVLLSALALIAGGALGNLVDRAASGAVTDFIDFYVGSYHWHTFNVADSAITVGIGLMLVSAFFRRPEAEEAPAES